MQELWHKENALNLSIANAIRLYPHAKYFAWVDADVQFSAQVGLGNRQQLQHFHVVQMWSMCQDLNVDHEVAGYEDGGEQLPGMVYQQIQAGRYGKLAEYVANLQSTGAIEPYGNGLNYKNGHTNKRLHPGHCGYAWAASRYALDTLGGLIDWSPCGANDHHMAMGLLGNIMDSVHGGSPKAFKDSLKIWGERAEVLKPRVGYVPGLVTHFWHGPKANRQYISRWQIINDNGFDPALDLKKDSQGLYCLTGRNKRLIADLMAYFRQRNEDATS